MRINAPRSAYQSRLPRNALTSSTILSATPGASTTLRRGRLRRGKPNGRHSVPQAVCTTSRPSCPRNAASRASARSGANNARSRESVVSVTVSQGVPDAICIARVSRSRFTYKTTKTEKQFLGTPPKSAPTTIRAVKKSLPASTRRCI